MGDSEEAPKRGRVSGLSFQMDSHAKLKFYTINNNTHNNKHDDIEIG